MSKLEKVIKGLEVCTNPATHMGCLEGKCPYDSNGCRGQMEFDALELLKKQIPTEPIHVHEEYPEHEWELDKDGKPDDFAWDYLYHNGPLCKRCHYSFCIFCKPDGWNDEPCVIDYYECPGCKKTVSKNKAFCDNCGQAMKWND